MKLDRFPKRVTLYEVAPRDGLQNEARTLSTEDKVTFIEDLARCGLPYVEITSFVRPDRIPQLADAVEVAKRVRPSGGTRFSALVPNRKGLERALEAGIDEVAVFMSASETHNEKNVNRTTAASLAAFREIIPEARDKGLDVRAYVSTVYGCPYEGDVDPQRAVEITKELVSMGAYQVSLGDTIGVADPVQVERVLGMVLEDLPQNKIGVHFHDTRGTALANIFVAVGMGITTVDSAAGGLGGCPYAPGAAGNVATEDVVYMLGRMGIETGVDLDALVDVSAKMAEILHKEPPSKTYRAILATRARAK